MVPRLLVLLYLCSLRTLLFLVPLFSVDTFYLAQRQLIRTVLLCFCWHYYLFKVKVGGTACYYFKVASVASIFKAWHSCEWILGFKSSLCKKSVAYSSIFFAKDNVHGQRKNPVKSTSAINYVLMSLLKNNYLNVGLDTIIYVLKY